MILRYWRFACSQISNLDNFICNKTTLLVKCVFINGQSNKYQIHYSTILVWNTHLDTNGEASGKIFVRLETPPLPETEHIFN